MELTYILPLDSPRASLETVGGKGAALAQMAVADLPVPEGFHITTAAYRAFVAANDLNAAIRAALKDVDADRPATLEAAARTLRAAFTAAEIPAAVAGAITEAYAALADAVVAVRSSATAEDLPDLSFAGQQETFLNVRGSAAVLTAVKHCWASLWTARAIGYRARHAVAPEELSLAVVVQRLVPAEVAGILFTANPLNGRRDQALVNAAWGLGEAVVGGAVTPDTFTVDKASGAIVDREIADKATMTVRVNGGTADRPVPEELRRAPSLSDDQIAALVQLGRRIEALYGDPRDIEWALAGGRLAVLQARPITALPEPEAAPPTAWPVPDPKGQYMRSSIVDFMPDPLTPLFASLVQPAINSGMQHTMKEMVGATTGFFATYIQTINDYAYMGMRIRPGDWGWILFRMLPAFPRLVRRAVPHWEEVARPRYAATVAAWEERPPAELSAAELLAGAEALTQAMGRYLTALQVDTLGIAAGSEMLFTTAYEKLIRKPDPPHEDPPAPTFLLGTDSLPIQAEKALYDLAQACREAPALAAYLTRTPVSQLVADLDREAAPDGIAAAAWHAWQAGMHAYLDAYGHAIYDLDFAKPVPAHDPTPALQTLQVYLRGAGRDPHARQQALLDRREAAIEKVRGRIRGLKRKIFNTTLRWAQTFARVREDSIFDIGLGYPALRALLLELGRRLQDAGALAAPADIFWLTQDEAAAGASRLDAGEPLQALSDRVAERKMRWRAAKRVTPPAQLPERGRVMGMKMEAYLPTAAESQTGTTLKGVGASPGRVTATARVLHGPEDFDEMRAGDILVADITTPAWTPLFAMASGIVTNVGGPLSHGSIVAREYGIPAVLGTGVATKRITSGQTITVDGDAGQVLLAAEEIAPAA